MDSFIFPAEWEYQKAIWIAWEDIEDHNSVLSKMIETLQAHVEIVLIVSNEKKKNNSIEYLSKYNINVKKITYYFYPDTYVYIRDPGPLFIKNNIGDLKLVKFKWNNYGYDEPIHINKDIEGITDYVSKKLNIPILHSKVIAEGGSIEVNGSGVLMSIKETAIQRNPNMTLKEIEREYIKLYGQKKIIWLNKSPISDKVGNIVDNFITYGANGHIDELARFVNKTTILLAKIVTNNNKVDSINNEIIEENYNILKKATDINGNPFNIIRVPMPDLSLLWEKQDKNIILPAASYLNFLISNNIVLLPKYWEKGMPIYQQKLDANAQNILQKAFPNRKIVQINTIKLNRYGGGMHCASQQQPYVNIRKRMYSTLLKLNRLFPK